MQTQSCTCHALTTARNDQVDVLQARGGCHHFAAARDRPRVEGSLQDLAALDRLRGTGLSLCVRRRVLSEWEQRALRAVPWRPRRFTM